MKTLTKTMEHCKFTLYNFIKMYHILNYDLLGQEEKIYTFHCTIKCPVELKVKRTSGVSAKLSSQ
jgi:hypothetical protein